MRLFILICILISVTSCVKQKDLLLFSGNLDSNAINLSPQYEIYFEKNDYVEVLIISENKEATDLFRPDFAEGRSVTNYTSGNPAKGGHLVDQNGNIKLPYIGEILVAGKSRTEVIKIIEEKLSEYINNPIVQINLLNFKVTVVGEVKQPSTIQVPNEKITIIQAISTAGDLTQFSKRDSILVIREKNGVRSEFKVNLNDKSVFQSEVFYLKQNDIIYVPQSKAKAQFLNNQLVYPLISIISVFLSLLNLILK